MRTADFHYELPPELIAQHPAAEREQSRLLVFRREDGSVEHRQFVDLPRLLRPDDVLVLNNSRVIPARLRGRKAGTGGDLEVLLLDEVEPNEWWVLVRPGKRVHVGTAIEFRKTNGQPSPLRAEALEKNSEGHVRLRFLGVANVLDVLNQIGEVPLPPYILRDAPVIGDEDRTRYQTVYADPPGSVAAPTAGLHYSPALLDNLREHGVQICSITLHAGFGTFGPVKADDPGAHTMHEEKFEIPEATAETVNAARRDGRRIIAVGTTTVRALETVAGPPPNHIQPGDGRTRIFIRPPYKFRAVDALVTNFHLPESTLLMLVSAFASPGSTSGREAILRVYAEAVRERYRFFSYGDAMLIL